MRVCVLLCGITCCGKSCIAERIVSALSTAAHCRRISVDERIDIGDSYVEARRNVIAQWKQVAEEAAADADTIVVIDDTSHLASIRRAYYDAANDVRALFLQLNVHCPVDVAIARSEQRRRYDHTAAHAMDSAEAIQGMFQRIERSWRARERKHTIDIRYDANNDAAQCAINEIRARMQHTSPPPSPPPLPSRQLRRDTVSVGAAIHAADLALRQAIGAVLRASEDKATDLIRLQTARRRILLELNDEGSAARKRIAAADNELSAARRIAQEMLRTAYDADITTNKDEHKR